LKYRPFCVDSHPHLAGFRLNHISAGMLFRGLILTLIVLDNVSLLIDTADLRGYLRGDGSPRF